MQYEYESHQSDQSIIHQINQPLIGTQNITIIIPLHTEIFQQILKISLKYQDSLAFIRTELSS